MHSRDDEQVQQFLYLSTPETAPFPVTVSYGKYDATTTTWTYVDSVIMLSNSSPEVLEVGFGDYSTILVSAAELNQPIAQRGIIARAPKKFYANLRVRQNAQTGSLTAKGRAGLGTTFRIGHLLNTPGRNKSNFIGIMATEDNTQVTISGYAPNIALQNAGIGIPDVYTPGSTISFTLNAGESYVVSVYCRVETPDNSDALMGALVSSPQSHCGKLRLVVGGAPECRHGYWHRPDCAAGKHWNQTCTGKGRRIFYNFFSKSRNAYRCGALR